MTRHSGVPAYLVTGVSPEATGAVTIGLQWDLPRAVAVSYDIDPHTGATHRVVADAAGLVDRTEVQLAHACRSCLVAEDVAPTLERLAASGRWSAIVVPLPIGCSARPVCRAVTDRPASSVRIAAVVAALAGSGVAGAGVGGDLLGSDLLAERGLAGRADDRRGVAEVACGLVESADLVLLTDLDGGGARPAEVELVRMLARPDALVVADSTALPRQVLLDAHHDCEAVDTWVDPLRRPARGSGAGQLAGDGAWSLALSSDRPFHPRRLQEQLEALGGGPYRSRGCFWLPTRPDQAIVWDGAGGQLSIGNGPAWGDLARLTNLLVSGLGRGAIAVAQRDELVAAFDAALCTVDELAERGLLWSTGYDGLEPWLGPIRPSTTSPAPLALPCRDPRHV